ncbi:MAG: PAS domain S-box protein [Deltaproteobacteria bacterium]|nr:PAS domain S-box protein [Deltaproteobacteria bacterium]
MMVLDGFGGFGNGGRRIGRSSAPSLPPPGRESTAWILARINECNLELGLDSDRNIRRLVALCGTLMGAVQVGYERLRDGGLQPTVRWTEATGAEAVHSTAVPGLEPRLSLEPGAAVPGAGAVNGLKVEPTDGGTRVTVGVRYGGVRWGVLRVALDRVFVLGDIDRRILEFVAAAIGIEEQREGSEVARRQTEERSRLVFETIRDGLGIVDPFENVVFANQAYADILGFTREEIVSKNLRELLVPGELDKVLAQTEQRREGKATVYELAMRRKDGEVRQIRVSAVPWRDPNGAFVGTIGAIVDITEEKKAEAERLDHTARLRRAIEKTIQAITTMAELRDPYTAGHQRRVAQLAAAIARETGLDDEAVQGIYLASVIHDIGKVAVPSEILSKPGRLEPVEFQLIQTHCTTGYNILKEIEFPWPIAQVVAQHHERLDGSGYPAGLKGAQILREARIVAVADVVEAMASHRPYRPALGVGVALEEIRKGSGRLYDPEAVEACTRLFEQGGFEFD